MVQRGGRFSGEAYVLLGNPLQLEVAVQKNRQHIGKRYVEVFPVRKLVRALVASPCAMHTWSLRRAALGHAAAWQAALVAHTAFARPLSVCLPVCYVACMQQGM